VLARAVVLPGTPLLVPGAGGGTDLLGDVRRVADAALDRLIADLGDLVAADPEPAPVPALDPRAGAPLMVLAPVPRRATAGLGVRRPSLAGVGVADRWVPAVAGWPDRDVPAAHAPASVALVALAGALDRAGRAGHADRADRSGRPRAHRPPVAVLEVSGEVPAPHVAALRGARAVVVAGGVAPGTPGAAAAAKAGAPGDGGGRPAGDPGLDPAVAAALDLAAAPGRWTWTVTTVPGGHEHLPAVYRVAEGVAGRG